jgi:hypothetical protein
MVLLMVWFCGLESGTSKTLEIIFYFLLYFFKILIDIRLILTGSYYYKNFSAVPKTTLEGFLGAAKLGLVFYTFYPSCQGLLANQPVS